MGNKLVRSMLSLSLTAAMVGTSVMPAFAASSDPNSSAAREAKNSAISQAAATQGSVLLENNGALPIATKKVALFGYGVYGTVKGGTGSGDVYLKEGANINVLQGFEKAGYDVVNKAMVTELSKGNKEVGGDGTTFVSNYDYEEGSYAGKYAADVSAAAAATDTAIYVITRNSGEGADRKPEKGDYYLLDSEYANLKLLSAKFDKVIVLLNVGGIVDTNFFNGKAADTADNKNNRNKIAGLDALVLMSQGGQNSGPAIVQNLNGEVNFSGKLTDTWAVEYKDYPGAGTIAKEDGNSMEEIYDEGVYVGYRKFDSFNLPVAYEFGYGSSYTTFETTVDDVTATADTVTVTATVKNTGKVAGKEVVEVYFSAPEGSIDKPYQELAAYAKTAEIEPGKSQTVTVSYATADMSSYDEAKEAYVMEDGTYTIRVGNSSRNTAVAAKIALDADAITEQCQTNLDLTKDQLENGTAAKGVLLSYVDGKVTYEAKKYDVLDSKSAGYVGAPTGLTSDGIKGSDKALSIKAADVKTVKHTYQNGDVKTYVSADANSDSAKYAADKKETSTQKLDLGVQEMTATETLVPVKAVKSANLADVAMGLISTEDLVANMSTVELADLVIGGTYNEFGEVGGEASAIIGNNASTVYGAAGESTSNLYASRVIPNIVFSDGPAGIRITNSYIEYYLVGDAKYEPGRKYYSATYGWAGYTYKDLNVTSQKELDAAKETNTVYTTDNVTMYQFCTAFPIGTMLAQTWDVDLVESVGRAIGVEMLEYGVTSFLAPGMNIHRNPMCGRNFEYHSEDPVVSGKTAAAESIGIATDEAGNATGIDVTLKHFAFNDQESDRMGSNSIVTERAAREIYLKHFEIAVKTAQPDYIMSSYNMVNGTSTFINYGLLTSILRDEWAYEGFVMTDWYSVWGVRGLNQGKNIQALEMITGNDHEEPGGDGDVKNVISGVATGVSRLGDVQKSAINMINVLIKTPSFKNAYALLVKEDALTQAKLALVEAQKTGDSIVILEAEAAVEAARGDYAAVAAKYAEIAKAYSVIATDKANSAADTEAAVKAAADAAAKSATAAETAVKNASASAAEAAKSAEAAAQAVIELEKKLAAADAELQAAIQAAKDAADRAEAAEARAAFMIKKVVIKKATPAKKSVKVTVKKVAGADKYQIKINGKTYTTTKTTKTIKGLKSGKCYTLKVRAAKTVAGKTVYTAFTKKTVKAK